jgi:hypothetical protein
VTTVYTGTLPSKVDLACYRGDTWSQQFRFLADGDPIDLSGYEFASWCRSNAGEVYLMAVVVESDPGLVTLSIRDWDEVRPGDYIYDLEAADEDDVQTWVQGRLRVHRDVTNEVASAYSIA